MNEYEIDEVLEYMQDELSEPVFCPEFEQLVTLEKLVQGGI